MPSSPSEPPRHDLRQTAEALERALADACAPGGSAHEADTGELIRIEEMLAVAREAARRAIAVRRRARQEAAATSPAAAGFADLSSYPAPTSHRLFDDRRGVRWDVWAVYPETRPSQLAALPGSFRSGWLVFESADEKRRLSPIPTDWQAISTHELEQLCEKAEVAPRRGRARGT